MSRLQAGPESKLWCSLAVSGALKLLQQTTGRQTTAKNDHEHTVTNQMFVHIVRVLFRNSVQFQIRCLLRCQLRSKKQETRNWTVVDGFLGSGGKGF